MKKIIILLLLIASGFYAGAQTLDTVVLVSKAKRFQPGKHILFSFELRDTVDAVGNKTTMSRSYYFDNKHRMLASVREYYNPRKPEKGKQVIYSFGANKLASVTIIPPRSECKRCETKYYYAADTVSLKQGKNTMQQDPANFIARGHYFLSGVPKDLPWGFFNDEILVNGEQKRIKNKY
jgi:hypothetical protein